MADLEHPASHPGALSHYPLAPHPIARTVPKAIAGLLLIGFSYSLVKVAGWKAIVALGVGLMGLRWGARAHSDGLRLSCKVVLDCLMCGTGVALIGWGFWFWQHVGSALLLGVPAALTWLWWSLARDEGFGPFPQEPFSIEPLDSENHNGRHARRRRRRHRWSAWDDGGIGVDDPFSAPPTNPATGLPMIGSVDAGGNPYGCSDDSSHGGWDQHHHRSSLFD